MFRALIAGRTWRETAYLLIDLAVGVVGFTFVVTGLSLGVGLLITLIGLPVLGLTLLGCRAGAWLELRRARLLGLHLPDPPPLERTGSLFRRLSRPLVDGVGWRAAAYFVLMLPVGIVTFTVTLTIWSTALGLLTLPAWAWSLPHGGAQFGDSYYWNRPWQLALSALAGAGLTLLAPWVVRGLAVAERGLVHGLLGTSRRALEERAEVLSDQRARTVDASIEERRRLERDLHDGAQQRLVALSLELGMIEQTRSEPADREALQRLRAELSESLEELRAVSRGIYPAVLTGHGLSVALQSLVARAPCPLDLDVALGERLPEPLEVAAYYIVSESLTNIGKHSRATHATVRVAMTGDNLLVDVSDNGVGGADTENGTGLRGLADRVEALGGTLAISTPSTGGTRITARIPAHTGQAARPRALKPSPRRRV